MSKNIINVTDASFDADILQQPGVVLVDFWAEWCGPCKMLSPILADIADEYAGEARVTKINSDENKASGERFTVRGLPTIIVFVNGVEAERILGTVSKTRLAQVIDKHLEA